MHHSLSAEARAEMQGQSTFLSIQAGFERLGKGPTTAVLLGQHYMGSPAGARVETNMHSQCKTAERDVGAGADFLRKFRFSIS